MTVRILDELGKGVEALRSEKFTFGNGPNVNIVHKAVFGPKPVDVEITGVVVTSSVKPADDATDLLDLDAALEKLTALDERQSRFVELRFFGGLTVPEVAEVMGVSLSTVERSWRLARAWLLREVRSVAN